MEKYLDSLEGQRRLEQASDSPHTTSGEAFRRADFPDLSDLFGKIDLMYSLVNSLAYLLLTSTSGPT